MKRVLAFTILACTLFLNTAFAQESAQGTLQRLRKAYPTPMSPAQIGQMLNETAWTHKAEGFALLGKAGGSNCPSPSGPKISCDFLINTSTMRGWDVLQDSDGAASVNGPSGTGDDITGMISSGDRTIVLPVAPNGSPTPTPGPGPTPPPATDLLTPRVDALSQLVDALQQEVKAQRAALDNFAGTQGDLSKRVQTVEDVLTSRPVPVRCSAKANFGGFGIPLSCSLGF